MTATKQPPAYWPVVHATWNPPPLADAKPLTHPEPREWDIAFRGETAVDCDMFAPHVPFWTIDRIFAVVMLCPQHTFTVVTDHPDRAAEYVESRTGDDNIEHECEALLWHEAPGVTWDAVLTATEERPWPPPNLVIR